MPSTNPRFGRTFSTYADPNTMVCERYIYEGIQMPSLQEIHEGFAPLARQFAGCERSFNLTNEQTERLERLHACYTEPVEHHIDTFCQRNPNQQPYLGLHRTINTGQFRMIEKSLENTCIGDITHLQSFEISGNEGRMITYSIERVDTPYKWNRYTIYHFNDESPTELVREYRGDDMGY